MSENTGQSQPYYFPNTHPDIKAARTSAFHNRQRFSIGTNTYTPEGEKVWLDNFGYRWSHNSLYRWLKQYSIINR